MIHPYYDETLCASITASLDLRQPNAEALTTIVKIAETRLAGEDTSFEGVIEVATAVGKTFIMAAAIDYFTALGYRHFAVIAPGRTIANKTVGNFTPGHRKSLLPGMTTQPLVITSETFDTPLVATAMSDESVAKVFVFTVQALIIPTSKADRKTHTYQENLGSGFYEELASTEDLIVFADEHHVYGGPKFDAAVRGLNPRMLIGLTATPLKGSPVIFTFPLPAAIAGGFVKIPVIAGRSDDRTGLLTKLTDGARLLDTKQAAIDAWRAVHPELSPLHAVMLVIAQDTDDADNAVGILRKPDFHNGVFSDAILPIHSNLQDVDKALADLEEVEDPDSPIRVIVSVGMLREGWDVKNVYVICSLRASVSKILTEQTLGRGLRLAFGKPTGNEMLDTLEVVAHDRYEALINGVNKLREEFVDWKTIAESEAAVADGSTVARDAIGIAAMMSPAIDGATVAGAPVIADIESRIRHNVEAVSALDQRLRVRPGMPVLTLPVVKSTIVESLFSLADITDFEPFRAEGRRIGVNPENKLRRTLLGGEVTTDEAGKRTTRYVRRTATDTVFSEGDKVPVEVLVKQLTDDVMNSGAVPPRKGQPEMLNRIVAAFLDGLGKDNIESLAAYGRRAADAIVAVIRASRANRKSQTRLDDEVGLRVFDGIRIARKSTCNKGMPFERGVGYTGWVKSLYSQDWFDAESTEFALAGLLDDTDSIAYWLRLQVGDLPLGWAGDEHAYNPDFIAVDKDEIHWVIEGKADDTAKTPDVVAKQKAAIRWATHVSAATGASWRYVFVCEKDIKTAKGSWAALKGLAGAD